jgi:hypothetical protein
MEHLEGLAVSLLEGLHQVLVRGLPQIFWLLDAPTVGVRGAADWRRHSQDESYP